MRNRKKLKGKKQKIIAKFGKIIDYMNSDRYNHHKFNMNYA
jgi:uncharacterized protein YkvS